MCRREPVEGRGEARAARDAGRSADEISDVLEEATSGDYDHFLAVTLEHVEEPGGEDCVA